jgi:hypothetical protein
VPLPAFGGPDRGAVGDTGRAELDPGGEFDVEFISPVERNSAGGQGQIEDVPTARPVGGEEVEVVARHLDTGDAIGKSEPDDGTAGGGDPPLGLMFGDLRQRRVGRGLRVHAAKVQICEVAIDPHGDDADWLGRESVDDLEQFM